MWPWDYCLITMVVETGKYEVKDNKRKFIIDSPAGEVTAYTVCDGQKVVEVLFENVSSFMYEKDFPIELDGKVSILRLGEHFTSFYPAKYSG